MTHGVRDRPVRITYPILGMKAKLLPFIEQVQAYDAINMKGWDYNGAANSTVRVMQVAGFLCPSDINVPTSTVTVPARGQRVVNYTSYPNNIGTTWANNGGRFDGPAYMLGQSGIAGRLPSGGPSPSPRSRTAPPARPSSASSSEASISPTQHGLSEIYTDTTDSPPPTNVSLTNLRTHCNAAGPTSTVYHKGADWMDQAVGGGGGYTPHP